MATKKPKVEPKAKDAPAAKKAGGKMTAAKDAPPKTKPAKAAPAAQKAAAPVKLSSAQSDLLAKIGAADAAGYLSTKKAEQRSIDALAERKLVKKGAKDKASGNFRYLISSAGKKHLGAAPAPAAPAPAPMPAEAPAPAAPAAP